MTFGGFLHFYERLLRKSTHFYERLWRFVSSKCQNLFSNSTMSKIACYVALRRCMCHRHVVNVIYVVCRRATLVLLLCWLVILGEPPPRTKPMGCYLFILLYSFLRRRDTEPLPKEQACLSHLFVIIHPRYRFGCDNDHLSSGYLPLKPETFALFFCVQP